MQNVTKDWVCTDPDNNQWGRQLSEKRFEFKEKNPHYRVNREGKWINFEINLNDYSDAQIEDHISTYYGSVEEIEEIYGEKALWIIAECIFEQESGLY